MIILSLIVSWFSLSDKLEVISSNVTLFTVFLVSPLLFAQAVFVLTPEEDDIDAKTYFMKTNRLFFILLLGLIAVNSVLLFFLSEDSAFMIIRALVAMSFIAINVWQKKWLRIIALCLYGSFAAYIYLLSIL